MMVIEFTKTNSENSSSGAMPSPRPIRAAFHKCAPAGVGHRSRDTRKPIIPKSIP